MIRLLLSALLFCYSFDAVRAPVPKTRLATAEMVGRWKWTLPNHSVWYVWLSANGDYAASTSETPENFSYLGRWWVDGEKVVILERAAGAPADEAARYVRYEAPRGALTHKTPTEGE